MENLKKALISNKEDVSTAIAEMGVLYEQVKLLNEKITYLEIRQKRAFATTNIIIPITTLPMIITGSVLMATNNDYGKPVFYTGVGLLVGCEVVWNGGHFIFKLW